MVCRSVHVWLIKCRKWILQREPMNRIFSERTKANFLRHCFFLFQIPCRTSCVHAKRITTICGKTANLYFVWLIQEGEEVIEKWVILSLLGKNVFSFKWWWRKLWRSRVKLFFIFTPKLCSWSSPVVIFFHKARCRASYGCRKFFSNSYRSVRSRNVSWRSCCEVPVPYLLLLDTKWLDVGRLSWL